GNNRALGAQSQLRHQVGPVGSSAASRRGPADSRSTALVRRPPTPLRPGGRRRPRGPWPAAGPPAQRGPWADRCRPAQSRFRLLASRATDTAPCSQPLPSRHNYCLSRRAAATANYSSDTWIVYGSTRNVTNLALQWFEWQPDCSIGPAGRPTATPGPHGSMRADDYPPRAARVALPGRGHRPQTEPRAGVVHAAGGPFAAGIPGAAGQEHDDAGVL